MRTIPWASPSYRIVRGRQVRNHREWAAEKRNPTSEAHYDGITALENSPPLSFRVPFRFRVNYVSENTSAQNAHQPPTDNTRTDADLLRARRETKNCREWAAEKRNPTSEAHYDGTFPTTSRTTTNDNGIRQLTAEIWDQGKRSGVQPDSRASRFWTNLVPDQGKCFFRCRPRRQQQKHSRRGPTHADQTTTHKTQQQP
jgi:hypothetical protein